MMRFLAVLAVALALAPSVPEVQAQQPQRPQTQQQRQPQRAQPPPRPAPRPARPAVLPSAQTLDTQARQALIMDLQTGAVLYERNADDRMAPSSMSKVMTAYVVFERLRDGRLRMSDELPVSERAQRMGGSRMFVEAGTSVRVEDLLRGMIVQSGNDSCVVFAEAISGSEEAFAELMNATARRLGLTGSNFRNSSGWPDAEHYSTARDLALLSRRLLDDFPAYFPLYSERVYTYNNVRQENRNPLLGRFAGADGLKTGHTEAGGYGLIGTAQRGGRRILLVLNGLPSIRARADDAERLMDWAFREYENITLFRAGAEVEQTNVWMGATPRAALVTPRDVLVSIPRRARAQLRVSASFDQPVAAPVERGLELGTLTVAVPGMESQSFPLVAGADIERLGLFGRVGVSIGYLLWSGRAQ